MVEAIVEFDYKAQQDDELTIAVGDIISNIRKDEGGWWEGELAGRRGLFPDNFVRELKDDGCRVTQGNQLKTPPPSDGNPVSEKKGGSARKRRCKAAFSYTPQNNDELELKVGDIIEIVGEVEEGWWEGSLNGKIGMFPSNFTKELDEAEDPPKDTPEPLQDGTDASNSVKVGPGTANEEDESSSAKSTESSKIQPKKVRGIGFGDIFKDQPIKLRPRSMELDGEAEKQQVVKKPSQATSAQESAKVEINGKVKANEFCKVLFPYEAQNEDELSIREGDIVAVISKECADTGWWLGELDGRRGVFPDNFVKLLVAEGEKERPKKPPPPGSSATKPLTDSKAEDKKVPPERPESLPQRGEEKVAGDETKTRGDILKPGPPAIPPKKPLPPKTNNSHGRPSFLPTKPPQRPERPPVPRIQLEGGCPLPEQGGADRPGDIEVEDFDSIVSCSEKLNHPTASRPRVTDRRPRSQTSSSSLSNLEVLDSVACEGDKHDAERRNEEQDSVPKISDADKKTSESKLPVPPKPAVPPSPWGPSEPRSRSEPPTLEELRTQLRDLRATLEQMKMQHKKEIKQLMNELDEEKKIRLSLQVEVEHIKKVLSK
ncbi:SH3 domain-containing kinase-binding protein 1-like isoform X2 [Scleropages formosus]|uniref:Osteoclast-stimulating factor 1 n=1 Tax=Scleropages formosus TaxID=113540 RepID=A0A8C9RGW1_SCLFO|nr:SH3 domain-containing kinase-binding protein 1-like isoform X2 [Scleropages formosus]